MLYRDRVYGKISIDEPVILELIASPTLQRLKHIDQAGYFKPHFPHAEPRSRFNHSVGVFLLLKLYGAPLDEQIAGLIHDVSHSAFSHCIDYVLSTGNTYEQSHQDNVFEAFVQDSDIPAILQERGISPAQILNDDNFSLKERPLPDLCADRLDYSLRDGIALGEIEDARIFLDHLIVQNGQWLFKNFAAAERYATFFLRLNAIYYSGLPSARMFLTVGDYLRYALKRNYLSFSDLYTIDQAVLDKIARHLDQDEHLSLLFDRMNGKIPCHNSPWHYDARVFCKSRVVDPFCLHDGKIMRVSEINPDWRLKLKQESHPKEYFLKFDR